MSHPLLAPVTVSWGTRYQVALANLRAAWSEALQSFEGTNRIDMDLFTQEFMKNPKYRPILVTFVYNIKNNMDELDVEDMLVELGKTAKGIEE